MSGATVKRITVRLGPVEYSILRQVAKKKNLNYSQVIRYAILRLIDDEPTSD